MQAFEVLKVSIPRAARSLATHGNTLVFGTPVLGGLHHVYKWEEKLEIA